MNAAITEKTIRQKHLDGTDLLREEVDTLFRHIDALERLALEDEILIFILEGKCQQS